MVEEEGQPELGIDIFAQSPNENIGGSITLMSGGEKAMTAIALVLALFQFKPSPIYILDEIDARLDDVNCQCLCDALKEYARPAQLLIITHNKITMDLADTFYGVTMQEPGISKLVSVKFQDIEGSGPAGENGLNHQA
jgi:chromosome segregation protein